MSQIQHVKEATDIIAVINERIPLQRSGRNYRANCPFHGEKTPSFFVNEDLQRYKCFGCGESGDAFTFLEKYEAMTFAEALEYLADRAGIKLEKMQRSPQDDERDQLLSAMSLAKEYFHYLLTKHPAGTPARAYLKQRGVNNDSVTLFQLGYALDEWDGLIKYLTKKKKYSMHILDKAGLAVKGKAGRYYDRFRGRVIFPLTNHRGQVVGFSGRTLNPEEKTAKYINSPETSVYHKSELLFGYAELRKFIREEQIVVVVEGELDVVSSAQAHVNTVVGLKGSALTEKQAQLLERVAQKVILALDADSAGVEATKRAIEVSAERNYELRVLILPEGKDPDQLAQTKPALWRETVKQSHSVPDFFLTVLQRQFDVSQPEGKREMMKRLIPVLSGIEHAVEQDFYIKKVATVLSVRESVVREDLRRGSSQKKNLPLKKGVLKPDQEVHVTSPLSKVEQHFLYLLLNDQAKTVERLQQLKQVSFSNVVQRLLTKVRAVAGEQYSLQKLTPTLPADLQQVIMDILSDPRWDSTNKDTDEKAWKQVKSNLEKVAEQELKRALIAELNAFDQLDSLTEEQEARQQELLVEIARQK